MTRRATWAALAALAGCGGVGGDDNPGTDAGGGTDAGNYCESYVSLSPTNPIAPALITASGSIVGPAGGISTYEWTVRKQGDPGFDPSLAGQGTDEISFLAPTDGLYTVTLFGARDVTCASGSASANVVSDNAITVFYRVRVVPPAGQWPAQEHVRSVTGSMSTTFQLDDIAIDAGIPVAGTVRDTGAQPVAAYLRFTTVGDVDPMSTEAFSSDTGQFDVSLTAGTYDVLVVPQQSAAAPVLLTNVAVSNLSAITVPVAMPVSGSVLGPGGAPVAGAAVSLRIGGVPTTIAVTDATGAFTVMGHPGGATSVHVAPPDGSGLPALELDESAGLVAAFGDDLAVHYDAGLTARPLAVPVRRVDGTTPAPGARVTLAASGLDTAGTVASGAGPALPMRGVLRVSAVAESSGDLPALTLPEAIYDVVVEPPAGAPPGEGVAVLFVDLRQGMPSPASLALAPWATLAGAAVDQDAVGLESVRVTAIPTGILAGTTAASATAGTDAGAYTLSVAGGGTYELVFDSLDHSRARVRVAAQAGPAGQSSAVDPVVMPRALDVVGTVNLGANGVAGASLTLLCYECSGQADASWAIAEAVTGVDGGYSMAVPNPGESQ